MPAPLLDRLRYWSRDPDLDDELTDTLEQALIELERLYKLEGRLLHALALLEKAGI